MIDEIRVETMELCVTACEKFANNNEVRTVLRFVTQLSEIKLGLCVLGRSQVR